MAKVNFVKSLVPIGKKIAGGFVGNQVTNLIEGQSFAASNKMIAPGITLAAAIAAAVFAPPSMKDFADGMAVVAGVELVESLTNDATTGTQTQGYKMGFTPTLVPDGTPEVGTPQGGMLRAY